MHPRFTRPISRKFVAFVFASVVMTVFAQLISRPTAEAAASAKSSGSVHISMKVPSKLRSAFAVDADVKTFLDRDFRSRYPVAGPFRSDVADSWIDAYSIQNVADGYGGYDTRHYFRVTAQHVTGSFAFIDIYVYRRSQVEADQDPILLERFEVVGWQR